MHATQPTPRSRLHDRNRHLVHCLVIGLRTVQLHAAENTMVGAAVDQLYSAVHERLSDAESVTVSARNLCLFVDMDRVRVTSADYVNVRYLMRMMEDWSLPGLRFSPRVTPKEIEELLVFLGRTTPKSSADLPWDKAGGITAEAPEAVSSPATRADDTLRAYTAAMDISRSLYDALDTDEPTQQRSLRRVTQTLVDTLVEDESALLGMTSIKNFDGYLFNHCTNVAVLSVALGRRLALSKPQLGELFVAGLLHDLGKTMVAKETLDKTGTLTDDEWQDIRRHPVRGVEILLERGHIGSSILAAIVASFEHHLDYDLSGYPHLLQKDRVSLFGRIVAVADCYDAITTPRPYRTVNLTPFDGIRFLVEHMGTKFDPILVKMFVELQGVYPPGTMVRLSSDEVGVVSRAPLPGSPLDRPLVHIVRGSRSGSYVDLAATQDGQDRPLVVTAVVNPDNQGLLPALDMSLLTNDEGGET
jgi:HD-GYP domain-containing protein (c-di-GMP phosphodiesterase class II)